MTTEELDALLIAADVLSRALEAALVDQDQWRVRAMDALYLYWQQTVEDAGPRTVR